MGEERIRQAEPGHGRGVCAVQGSRRGQRSGEGLPREVTSELVLRMRNRKAKTGRRQSSRCVSGTVGVGDEAGVGGRR